ncbi:hypothetical protein [Nonomuraea sp. NEAU-A123]|uniref:hypothetical protein n=1 Tax=Nonomuraea sp. NEAU-A123 TaxID=2839649 RepID=UPI001BE4C6E4|nr:hypothetical protein [Nonomuraea sp. NEAU-A123]MBT2230089.1 hypothetical protein [Nonomuraea sp. NEAU-A123]MBT2230641.1 hypothetical protein [Nonomuraea sp. NEAU-A123]
MIAEQDEITRERIQTGRRVLRKESAMFKSCLRNRRAALVATWVASVNASAGGFTTGAGTPAETIPNTDVLYWSGTATATTFVPGQVNAAAAQALNVSRIAFSKTTGSGDNSAVWNPTIVIDVPAQAVEGTCTGTVNHSVA